MFRMTPPKKFLGTFAVLLAALVLGVTPACSSTDEESSSGGEGGGEAQNELQQELQGEARTHK